jgi:hypothetical protein
MVWLQQRAAVAVVPVEVVWAHQPFLHHSHHCHLIIHFYHHRCHQRQR